VGTGANGFDLAFAFISTTISAQGSWLTIAQLNIRSWGAIKAHRNDWTSLLDATNKSRNVMDSALSCSFDYVHSQCIVHGICSAISGPPPLTVLHRPTRVSHFFQISRRQPRNTHMMSIALKSAVNHTGSVDASSADYWQKNFRRGV
jgi:hypothetical protein